MSSKLSGLWLKKIGLHRGSPRLWFDCLRITAAGLHPGTRFDLLPHGKGLKMTASPQGKHLVSSKKRNGRIVPVVDVGDREVLAPLAGEEVVRVVIREDAIFLLPLASEIAKRERLERLRRKLQAGEPIAIASLAHGGGVLSSAAHTGLHDAGLRASTAVCNEIDPLYLEQSISCNHAVEEQTVALCAPMQEVAQDNWLLQHLQPVEVMELGIPCSGASLAGRASRGLSMPEEHPEVGHLVHAALVLIQKLQPVAVVIENVPSYKSSASAAILRSQLRDMGYQVREHTLAAQDWGSLENRVRWALVATTDGLQPLDDVPTAQDAASGRLGDLLDAVPLDAECWRPMDYLKAKEARDRKAGKGFFMQTVNADSASVPTIRKQYSKMGSTDPLVQHPEKPELLRKFTPGEHARIKGIPGQLIEGLSATSAHELLGQSVVYAPFRALFRALGTSLKACMKDGQALSKSTVALRLEEAIG